MRIAFIILLLLSLTRTQSIAQDTWSTKASMATGRWGSGAGNVGGIVYVVGGYNATATHLTTVEAYTASTNTWVTKTARPSVQTSPAYGVINSILYTAGGTNSSVEISDLWSYDPLSNAWTAKTSMPAVRQSACGGVINGLFYVVGGRVGSTSQSALTVYDPTSNTWTTKASMPTARYGAAAGVINGLLYVAGGRLAESGNNVSTVEVYNPTLNSWTTKASMPTARSSAASEVVNGLLYVMGGLNAASTVVGTVEVYDPVANTWSTKSSMSFARAAAAAVVSNGLIYVSGGYTATNTPVLQVEAYPLETEPIAQPTNLVVTDVQNTTFSYDITAASGVGGYIHIYKSGTAPTAVPIDGFKYIQGDVLSDGSIVQYSDNFPTGNSYASLTSGTSYFIKIFSYNGADATTNYLTTNPLSATITTLGALATEPAAQPTSITFGTVTDNAIPVSFTAPITAPAGYIAIRKAGSLSTTDPVDGTAYTAGTVLGDGIVAYSGSVPTFNDTGLNSNTTYFYKIYSYNGTGPTLNYLTSISPLSGNKTTTNLLAAEPTNQPTSLIFSGITSNYYAFDFTAATAGTTAPDGYIGIRKTGSVPTGAPVDGVTYAYPDVIGDGTVNFVGTGTSWTQSGASPSTTYGYAIFSYKGSGASINYKQVSPLTGSVTTLSDADTTDPVIGTNSTPTSVAQGSPVNVTAQFTDAESGIASATIYYASIEGVNGNYDSFVSASMTKTTGDAYTFQIPGTVTAGTGAMYYFYVENGAGLYSYSSDFSVAVQITGNGLTVPFSGFGNNQSNYRIVSVPIQATTATANAIFGDDLGSYDKTKWRMFHYQGTSTQELTGSSSLQIGTGYWLIANKSATLDTGPGTTPNVILYDPFKISLSPGWNQIGNPYPYGVNWQKILDWNTNPININKLRVYKGAWQDGTVLESFSGGFVMNAGSSAVVLEIPVYKDPAVGGRTRDPEITPEQNSIDNEDWSIAFNLKQGEINNNLGGIGMNHNASEGYDKYDDFNLPRFVDFLELNHQDKLLHKFSYSRDIVPSSENHTWEFSVESNSTDLITFNWDNSYFGTSNKQLVFWDVALQRGLDMKREKQYVFSKLRSGHFKVFYGDEQYVKEKTAVEQLVFHEVFPNPATDKVTISFSVPTEDRVTIEVIDLLGRKIATVADSNFKAGYHEVSWNTQDNSGNPVTTGIYITQIKSLKSDQQKRLSITK